MIRKISHIGIAVKNLDEGIELYKDILGLNFIGTEEIEDQKVKAAIFEVGDVHIELLEPTSPDSPISAYLEKTGGGMHHICFKVDNVDEALKSVAEKGIKLIDQQSRDGVGGTKIGFLHPKSTGRVLMELNS